MLVRFFINFRPLKNNQFFTLKYLIDVHEMCKSKRYHDFFFTICLMSFNGSIAYTVIRWLLYIIMHGLRLKTNYYRPEWLILAPIIGGSYSAGNVTISICIVGVLVLLHHSHHEYKLRRTTYLFTFTVERRVHVNWCSWYIVFLGGY